MQKFKTIEELRNHRLEKEADEKPKFFKDLDDIEFKWWEWISIYWCRYFWIPVTSFIDNTEEGIKNIFRWLPGVWYDRDWDYHYLLMIMSYKIKKMEKYWANRHRYVGQEKHAKVFTEMRILLDRLIKDDYLGHFTEGNPTFWHMPFKKLKINHFHRSWEYEDYLWTQDFERLLYLQKKYMRHLWD